MAQLSATSRACMQRVFHTELVQRQADPNFSSGQNAPTASGELFATGCSSRHLSGGKNETLLHLRTGEVQLCFRYGCTAPNHNPWGWGPFTLGGRYSIFTEVVEFFFTAVVAPCSRSFSRWQGTGLWNTQIEGWQYAPGGNRQGGER